MKKIILYIWQLPQNIAGAAILGLHKICGHKPRECQYNGIRYYRAKHVNDCGVSLGQYIFLDSDVVHNGDDVKHEHGHQLQSLYLGPLYLFVIGIPSGLHNLWTRLDGWTCNYYHFFTEAWADKLGGVER